LVLLGAVRYRWLRRQRIKGKSIYFSHIAQWAPYCTIWTNRPWNDTRTQDPGTRIWMCTPWSVALVFLQVRDYILSFLFVILRYASLLHSPAFMSRPSGHIRLRIGDEFERVFVPSALMVGSSESPEDFGLQIGLQVASECCSSRDHSIQQSQTQRPANRYELRPELRDTSTQHKDIDHKEVLGIHWSTLHAIFVS
jgi:hypothetical protein